MAVANLQTIEDRIDRTVAGTTEVSTSLGGIQIETMAQVFELAKMMAVSEKAVPRHLRGNPGTCLAVCIQALEWKMSPFAVANKSYEVNDRIAYESQVIHAVIEARAPLEGRLRGTYEGEGVDRKITVSGTFKGEAAPLEITTPAIKDIKVKNSPLWTSDPDQQLWYYGTRVWCRRYAPDILLGIYAEDELGEHVGFDQAKDVTPGLAKRLPGRSQPAADGKGFSAEHVEAEAAAATEAAQDGDKPKPKPKRTRRSKKDAEPKEPAAPETPEPPPSTATVVVEPASEAADQPSETKTEDADEVAANPTSERTTTPTQDEGSEDPPAHPGGEPSFPFDRDTPPVTVSSRPAPKSKAQKYGVVIDEALSALTETDALDTEWDKHRDTVSDWEDENEHILLMTIYVAHRKRIGGEITPEECKAKVEGVLGEL